MNDYPLPSVVEQLSKKVKISHSSQGLKMVYVRNNLARTVFNFSFIFFICFSFWIAKIEEIEITGLILIVLFFYFCISFAAYSYIFKCSIIFNKRYIQFNNLTFYPRKKILRRFPEHFLEGKDKVKIVRNNNGEHHFPMVELQSRYHQIEIHHKDSNDAREHIKLINECIELTKM
tara:strand:- start:491 stop:1015 length:525 start_codon:yes stop_codon:yes gene_type:complete